MLVLHVPLLLCAAIQDPPVGTAAVPSDRFQGRVLDDRGDPVDKASVRVEPVEWSERCLDGPYLFFQAGLQQLRCVDLPRGLTRADGTFHFPLNEDQRRLGILSGVRLRLVVEKKGCRSWFGPLGISLGRVGELEVRLSRHAPDDVIEGRLVAPRGHHGPLTGRVVVTDAEQESAYFPRAIPPQVVPVDSEGRFSVMRRAFDGPALVRVGSLRADGFYFEAAVDGFEPTRTWIPSDTRACELKLDPLDRWHPSLAIEFDDDSRRPAEIVVTFAHPAGFRWKRAIPATLVKSVGRWTPLTIEAPSFCGATIRLPGGPSPSSIQLRAVPACDVVLAVKETGGRPLAGAEVEIIDVEAAVLIEDNAFQDLRRAGAFRERTGSDGTLRIPRDRFARPSWMRVKSLGHVVLTTCLSRLATDATVMLRARPEGRARFKVMLPDRTPAAGTTLLFVDGAHRGGSLDGAPPCTGADGEVSVTLPLGGYACVAVHPGFAFEATSFEVDPAKEARIEIALRPASTGCIVVTAENKKPVSWQVVSHGLRGTGALEHGNTPVSITDAQGHARFDGIPLEADPFPLFVFPTMNRARRAVLDPDVKRTEISLERASAEVIVRVPTAMPHFHIHWRAGGFSSNHALENKVGDYRLTLPAGAVLIRARAPWLPILNADLVLEERTTSVLDWRLTDWPEVVLELAMSDASEPPSGVRVVETTKDEGPLRNTYPVPVDLAAPWRRPEDPARLLRFRVPPKGPFAVELQHASMMSRRIEIQDGKAPTQRVVLDSRSSPLTLRFQVAVGDVRGRSERLHGIVVRNGDADANELVSMSISLDDSRDGVLEVRWPTGLAPGQYTFTLKRFGLALAGWLDVERSFTAESGKPVALDYTKENESKEPEKAEREGRR